MLFIITFASRSVFTPALLSSGILSGHQWGSRTTEYYTTDYRTFLDLPFIVTVQTWFYEWLNIEVFLVYPLWIAVYSPIPAQRFILCCCRVFVHSALWRHTTVQRRRQFDVKFVVKNVRLVSLAARVSSVGTSEKEFDTRILYHMLPVAMTINLTLMHYFLFYKWRKSFDII